MCPLRMGLRHSEIVPLGENGLFRKLGKLRSKATCPRRLVGQVAVVADREHEIEGLACCPSVHPPLTNPVHPPFPRSVAEWR